MFTKDQRDNAERQLRKPIYDDLLRANDEIARLTRERDDLRIALRKIACDPLTDNPEASPAECLAECERIAWEALGINEPNTEKESG